MPHDETRGAVRSQAIQIARGWSPPDAPPSWALTAGVFNALADNEDLLAVASEIPAERVPALLFCAAVRYLIDGYEPPELAAYFSKAEAPEERGFDAGFEPAFRSFCLEHRAEVLAVCRRRRYQMNEVARSTQVALALGEVGGGVSSDGIALVDLGTGAGFGLHLDRYGYVLSDGRTFGDRASSLLLSCETRGTLSPAVPGLLPRIERRIGIDLDPVDLSDADDRAWLRACVPPEEGSLQRFDKAVEIARTHPSSILKGDVVNLLSAALDSLPEGLLPVVVDSYTAIFLSDEERAVLQHVIQQRGASRDLVWISLDPLAPLGTAGRHSVQGIDVPEHLVAESQQGGVFAILGLVVYSPKGARRSVLARAHPSGTSMMWLEEPGE